MSHYLSKDDVSECHRQNSQTPCSVDHPDESTILKGTRTNINKSVRVYKSLAISDVFNDSFLSTFEPKINYVVSYLEVYYD